MDAIVKWKTGQELSKEETLEVLIELFGGSAKRFNYGVNAPINKTLYELYEVFPSAKSHVALTFSQVETDRPFISLNDFGGYKVGEFYAHELPV